MMALTWLVGLPGAAAVGLVGLLKPSRERVLVGVGEDGADDALKLGMRISLASGGCCGLLWELPGTLLGSAWDASSSMVHRWSNVPLLEE